MQIPGGNYGSGKRGGGVSTLICAVYDDRRSVENDDDEPQFVASHCIDSCTHRDSRYSTFVRIGSGLSFADYVWVREKPWKVWDPKNPPAFLQTAKRSHEDKGDLYLEPEESVRLYLVLKKKIERAHIVRSFSK